MASRGSRLREPRLWLEVFVLVNLACLSADVYLAHSVNRFRHTAEYVPLYFSLAAPPVLLAALRAGERGGRCGWWRVLGHLVGWAAVGVGLAGVVFHLDSRFFYERTIQSLVYAAPFAAPLAYTGLGLLLIMNRMVPTGSAEWPYWVLLMALGGFAGNFVFSLTDHAQNGFFHVTEWVPVASSAFAVGFLLPPFVTAVDRPYLALCGAVLGVQALVGLMGFYLHAAADAVESCRPFVEQGRHQLTVVLPPDPVRLRADRPRVRQILVNLLTNAAKYTEPGGHVRLVAEACASALTLRVRDNGIGIEPDLLPRIFDLFHLGRGPAGRTRDGLGVGLALVKWLTELHGGSVAAFSDGPGKGAEFVVRLPAACGLAVPKPALVSAPPH